MRLLNLVFKFSNISFFFLLGFCYAPSDRVVRNESESKTTAATTEDNIIPITIASATGGGIVGALAGENIAFGLSAAAMAKKTASIAYAAKVAKATETSIFSNLRSTFLLVHEFFLAARN